MGISDPAAVSSMVREIVATQLCLESKNVLPSAKFTTDLGADSLDMVELIMALEEEFVIEIPADTVSTIVTVQDGIDRICDILDAEEPEEA